MPTEICPGCKLPRPNVGPWNEPGQPKRLCGPCKVDRWKSKPGNVEKLKDLIERAFGDVPPT